MDTIRNSGLGTVLRYFSRGKLFQYQEYSENFIVPEKYLSSTPPSRSLSVSAVSEFSSEKKDEEEHEYTTPVKHSPGEQGSEIITSWYSDDDEENPQNWSFLKKAWIMISISALTTFIYMGAAIYTPGIPEIMQEFNTSARKATVPLTVFVVGYGVGPMILSPLSEHAPLGRNPLYLITLFLYVIVQIPTAKAKSINELIGLRLLAGFLASPALSTGGATLGDIFPVDKLYLGLVLWGISACCGPTLGPLLGGIVSQLIDWRWTFWLMAIVTACVFLVLFVLLPETSAETLLHKRATRLRDITGNQNIKSEYEVERIRNPRSFKTILIETFWRPIYIAFREPIVFFLNLYCAFIYIIMNSWFEAFPIVFTDMYQFNKIETGLTYLSALVGASIGASLYLLVFRFQVFGPRKNPEIERFLISGMYGSFMLPIGLFIFSWTSTLSVHWIGPVIGATIFVTGAIMTFQANFSYLGRAFPRYLASVFAGNCLFRSCLAATFPLFVSELFHNLSGDDKFPVGAGGSVLGAIGVLMIPIPFVFFKYGVKIRGHSKFAN